MKWFFTVFDGELLTLKIIAEIAVVFKAKKEESNKQQIYDEKVWKFRNFTTISGQILNETSRK